MISSTRFSQLIAISALAGFACAPRAGRLAGTPAPARLPGTELPRGNQRIVFRWDYVDQALAAKGEGVARISSPDSVRLDFFLDGGLGGGYAIVIGDSISTPGGDQVRRYLPPVALLWASLGKLAVPPVPDTVAKVDGGTLRADIGHDPAWRVTFTGDRLTRLDWIAKAGFVARGLLYVLFGAIALTFRWRADEGQNAVFARALAKVPGVRMASIGASTTPHPPQPPISRTAGEGGSTNEIISIHADLADAASLGGAIREAEMTDPISLDGPRCCAEAACA